LSIASAAVSCLETVISKVTYCVFYSLTSVVYNSIRSYTCLIMCLAVMWRDGAFKRTIKLIIMVALWNRTDDYIFILSFVRSFFFFPRLISAVTDWMSAILPHMVWP